MSSMELAHAVHLEVRKPDGTVQVLPKAYSDMTAAWDDMLALQAKHGEANVRAIIVEREG